MSISVATVRYRARMSERRMLIGEIQKRADMLYGVMKAFEGLGEAKQRVSLFRAETESVLSALRDLPQPVKPQRRRKATRRP